MPFDLFSLPAPEPTRDAGLARLAAFLPRAGRDYAARRNYDLGPGRHSSVSCLSPYLRHRLVLEQEVLSAVLARFVPATAEKFISEVFWRTYFKGYLERHPTIWTSYIANVEALAADMARDAALRADVHAAESGRTGIDCFDAWADELVETGYLHNHARMWFASIWIFTLRLPWARGADFFLRHLIDGDPASNTLSWRWVAGLHTKGKTYLARPDNIARYTDGRFHPTGLSPVAEPLLDDAVHDCRPPPQGDPVPDDPALIVITEEDARPETLPWRAAANVRTTRAGGRAMGEVSEAVRAFADGAVADAASRMGGADPVSLDAGALAKAADAAGTRTIATAYPPVGPVASRWAAARAVLAREGYRTAAVLRAEDARAWRYADRGFFKVKKAIPSLLPS